MVLHIKADGDNDRLHYIYDFTGKPSVLIARGDKNSSLHIDWTNFMGKNEKGSVQITPDPAYSFATVIDSFVIFNDTNDRANYSDSSVVDAIKINPHNVDWQQVQLIESNMENATLEMRGESQNGSFSIKVNFFPLNFQNI
jgi:hypothetical protein